MFESCLINSMLRYVGQTITIFTASGGISGGGFTGVLAGVSNNTIKLISDIGTAPDCACGSACNWGIYGNRYRNDYYNHIGSHFGSIVEIPIDKIVCFVHNAV